MYFEVVDPVHGILRFPPFVRDIVDTLEFQRLRNIKQLGHTSSVYPGVNHTRFEHCLGVAHLVQHFIGILERNSGKCIDESLKKYTMIAGLLHDLGHGPYSHMWEKFVHTGSDKSWKHEETSCVLVGRIFEKIPLSECSKEHNRGVLLIKSLILGDEKMLRKELPKEDMFLSEIVSNPFCEVDVDKWDYIMRDSFYLKNAIDIPHDFFKLFQGAKISFDKEGVSHISYHIDDLSNILRLFETRSKLHREVYQMPFVALMEILVKDILVSAEANGFTLEGVKLSEAHQYPEIFIMLDDSIIRVIQLDGSPKLRGTKELIAQMHERKLYQRISHEGGDIVNGHDIPGLIIQRIDLPKIPKNLPVHIDNVGNFFQPFLEERSILTKTIEYKVEKN
ncbi:deoxynucleoside triphosphate triphosphohydrolase SAMHD1 homolog [Phlebotomus papatasi]|uniref:deoxynucleoside triphosphate triphosphohydrolase SAMHD1 homolog n=1 Tax=Phlebotomus papatasi TaxID=29031 RepID=UPI002483DF8C|nr:deoxynucleoside triphosphate triphosphohydrolase SAMHD1 homolog [Phlebotomus papatasi]